MAELGQELPIRTGIQVHDGWSPTETPMIQVAIVSSSSETSPQTQLVDGVEQNPAEAWLPITESRDGNIFTCVFHLLCSGIGVQSLLLPVAFASTGWSWGIICLLVTFIWQLYTAQLLVQLHEPGRGVPAPRYSRYLQLSMAAFGSKLGKLLALFPVMYLSGGTCVTLVITGGSMMDLLFKTLTGPRPGPVNSLTPVEWFLVFTCLATALAQRPNLNSISGMSLTGAIASLLYCNLLWAMSMYKGRPNDVSYDATKDETSEVAEMSQILNAIGIIALAFRGHNLVLEIQGTLPSNMKVVSRHAMQRGVAISYMLIAMCFFPLAIAGFWAYGNKVPYNGGLLTAFMQFHSDTTSKCTKASIYFLVVTSCIGQFQIYAMPTFDNLELRYISMKKARCPWWVRAGVRVLFGALVFLIAVAFPFLPSLAPLLGGVALPLTLVYPCFMWILLKKEHGKGPRWCLNLVLGCLGMVLSCFLIFGAVWSLIAHGLDANFLGPH